MWGQEKNRTASVEALYLLQDMPIFQRLIQDLFPGAGRDGGAGRGGSGRISRRFGGLSAPSPALQV